MVGGQDDLGYLYLVFMSDGQKVLHFPSIPC